MGSAAAVIVCAINALGAPGRDLPPIELLAAAPPDVSANAEGFVRPGSQTIYVVASSPAFRQADCLKPRSLAKLASVIMHEAWHVRHGSDERGAYEAQLHTLLRLGVEPGSAMYRGVLLSMNASLRKPRTLQRSPTVLADGRGILEPPVTGNQTP